MRIPEAKTLIILAAVLLLSACSNLRLAYNNAPQLSWWWLDGYLDFSREQQPAARRAVDGFFEWHRKSQLPAHAAFLAGLQPMMAGDITRQQACRMQDDARAQLEPSLQRALQLVAEQLPAWGEPQMRALEKRYAKLNETARDDFLQSDLAERRSAAYDRAEERFERFYGDLGTAQQAALRDSLQASPFDAEQWYAERLRVQRDVVQTLRKLVADKPPADDRLAALRALVQRSERPPEAAALAQKQRVADYGCATMARLHNLAGAAQRQELNKRLTNWQADLRTLHQAPE